MSEEIKGKCYQEHEPTPNNPCEIKTILCNDIEIPVEFLKQNFVTVDGKKYIEIQQENQQLKEKINTYENPEDLTLMFMYCDEKAKDKIKQLKEVIEEVKTAVDYMIGNVDISEIHGTKLKQILDKAGDINEKKN